MNEQQFQSLLEKYLAGRCSDEERAVVETWYLRHESSSIEPLTESQWEQIAKSTAPKPVRTLRRSLFRWSAAAVAILLAVAWILWDQGAKIKDQGLAATEILPGGNRATLTLADGRVVELSDTQEGIIIGDNRISYQDGSAILESRSQSQDSVRPPAETRGRHIGGLGSRVLPLASITTPKGGTYSITLPDGSKVWLNAGTTLRYPERFDGDERIVELEGEAFFEVRQRVLDNRRQTIENRQRDRGSLASSVSGLVSHQPFLVKTQGQVVEVLGTSFNIAAYPDDAETKTTLVSGSVQVGLSWDHGHHGAQAGGDNADLHTKYYLLNTKLSPGQQATKRDSKISVAKVDTEPYTAWKNGNFHFENEPLESVMRQVARWYGVDVVFEEPLEGEHMYGIIGRDKPLSQVLRMLGGTRAVAFKVTGNTVHVYRR